MRLLDFWIARLSTTRLDAPVVDALRAGLYQLLILQTAEHAAVFETVQLSPARARGAVNGILRSAQRQRAELIAAADAAPPGVLFSHPDFLLERWRANFGADFERLCEWNNEPAMALVRVNQLRTSIAAFRASHPEMEPIAGYPNFFRPREMPHSSLQRGECYVQDPATSVAVELLGAQPGETVLDACAAPGGKTAYIAEFMRNEGRIVATDRDPARAELLRANLARLGVAIADVARCDWTTEELPAEIGRGELYDRILVDAPCSNTGVMRRRVDVRWRLTPDDFTRMQECQLAVLRNVIGTLKPGGTLVYSTCSVEPEENADVVARIGAEFPALELQRCESRLPFRDNVDGAYAARFQRVK